MAQNNNIVVYALIVAGGAQRAPPAGQTNHLPPFAHVGEFSHRRPDRRNVNDHLLTMGVPHHPKNKPPPKYVCWRDAGKDQMLARGYISDNAHFPDAEFQQIVAGMRRLKPACDELATASAANNMASMQAMDKAVLHLVKDCGKKLTKTIRTNNDMPRPGPGVPPAQVIVNPILLPLNTLPQCQWSIATAVPNTGPVGQNAQQANAPGPAQNLPAPLANPQAQNNPPPPGPANPQPQNNPPPPGPANPQKNRRPPGPANPQPRIVLRLGNLHKQKNPHPPANLPGQDNPPGAANLPGQDNPPGAANLPGPINPPGAANLQGPINPPGPVNIPAQNQAAHPMGILGTPPGMQHAPVNLQGPINPPGPVNIPAQDEAAPPMRILGTPLGMQHAAPADIPGAVAQIAEDPGFEYLGMAQRVPRAMSDLSQISEFFRNILYVSFFTY